MKDQKVLLSFVLAHRFVELVKDWKLVNETQGNRNKILVPATLATWICFLRAKINWWKDKLMDNCGRKFYLGLKTN